MSRNLNSATNTTAIAVAADYADAMMTARKAKNVLFLLLLLVLLLQIALFFLLKFNVVHPGGEAPAEQTAATPTPAATSTPPATQPGEVTGTQPTDTTSAGPVSPDLHKSSRAEDVLRYLIPGTTFLGTTMVVVFAVVLLLIVTIMLVGRLIGVSHVTSAFVWCVVLMVLLFPWQTILIGGRAAPAARAGASAYAADTGFPQDPTFKIPGVLYTWEEVSYDIRHFPEGPSLKSALKWVRYAGFPIVALLLLLMIQARSSRGLKFALGESEVQVEVSSP